MPPTSLIQVHGGTDIGQCRTYNEDAFGSFPELGLHLVVDGMGGVCAGVTAARIAVDSVSAFFDKTLRDPGCAWPFKMDPTRTYEENRLSAGIRLASQRIYAAAKADAKLRGMGAACAAVSIADGWIYLAHVGDCRVYRLRDGKLEQLTEDHSLVNMLLRSGQLKPEEVADFPHHAVITNALGLAEQIQVDTKAEETAASDVYLLCSDGLYSVVEPHELRVILLAHAELDRAVAQLIQRANERGGPDNIACVLARIAC